MSFEQPEKAAGLKLSTEKDNLSHRTAQESSLGMVKSGIFRDVLHDCAIRRLRVQGLF